MPKSSENERKRNKVQCIRCEKELDLDSHCDESEPDVWFIVHEGLIFRARGNYGSTQYDPMNGYEYLEMFLCDECLIAKGHLVTRVKYKTEKVCLREETFTDHLKRLRDKHDFTND